MVWQHTYQKQETSVSKTKTISLTRQKENTLCPFVIRVKLALEKRFLYLALFNENVMCSLCMTDL